MAEETIRVHVICVGLGGGVVVESYGVQPGAGSGIVDEGQRVFASGDELVMRQTGSISWFGCRSDCGTWGDSRDGSSGRNDGGKSGRCSGRGWSRRRY